MNAVEIETTLDGGAGGEEGGAEEEGVRCRLLRAAHEVSGIGGDMALAYFITFSTYGTWLHGTDKGKGSVDREHNQFGTEFVTPDAAREGKMREAMTQPAYTMDAGERQVVCDAIVELCREKGWRLWAVHIRSNHVHVVVTVDRDPGRVMSEMKARASRNLTRAGFDDATRKRWTRHGSTLHLFDEAMIADKIDYTLNRQGAPMARYDGREPRTK